MLTLTAVMYADIYLLPVLDVLNNEVDIIHVRLMLRCQFAHHSFHKYASSSSWHLIINRDTFVVISVACCPTSYIKSYSAFNLNRCRMRWMLRYLVKVSFLNLLTWERTKWWQQFNKLMGVKPIRSCGRVLKGLEPILPLSVCGSMWRLHRDSMRW